MTKVRHRAETGSKISVRVKSGSAEICLSAESDIEEVNLIAESSSVEVCLSSEFVVLERQLVREPYPAKVEVLVF